MAIMWMSGIAGGLQSAACCAQILTRDARGHVRLWDIVHCALTGDFGPIDFREKERAMWTPAAVPSWFGLDCRLGSIAMHFEHPSCFGAGAP